MNWYVNVPQAQGGQFCRARLRMYTESKLEQTLIGLPIIPLGETSSYEGVSELRLFEKSNMNWSGNRKPAWIQLNLSEWYFWVKLTPKCLQISVNSWMAG